MLDRLAGDVHKLEIEAAATTGTAIHVRSFSTHDQETKDDKSEAPDAHPGVEDGTQIDGVFECDEETNKLCKDVPEICEKSCSEPSDYDEGRHSSLHTGRCGHEEGGKGTHEEEARSQVALPTRLMSSTREESDEGVQLRSELREARKLVEVSRERLVAVEKM